jgi:hypothetical protein
MYVTRSACACALRIMYYQWRGTRSAGTCATGSKYWCTADSYFSSSVGCDDILIIELSIAITRCIVRRAVVSIDYDIYQISCISFSG